MGVKAARARHQKEKSTGGAARAKQAVRPASQLQADEDRRLREAGWIRTSEQLPPLGEVIQEVGTGADPPIATIPLMAKFPPDDLSSVRRESEVVLALVDEGVDRIERGPRLYKYVEYAHGRKVWDDWAGESSPFEGSPPPTHWCRIPGGVGDLERSTVASPTEAATASQRVGGPRAASGAWISVTEQLPPLGEVIWNDPKSRAEGTRRESQVVLVLDERALESSACAPLGLAIYSEMSDGSKVWDYRGCPELHPTHWCPIPVAIGALRERSAVASPTEAAMASTTRGRAAPVGAWISVTEQLPPLGEVEENDPGVPSEGTRRESQVVAVLIIAPSYGRDDREVGEPRLAKYIVMSNGNRYWQNYLRDGPLRPTHWCALPQGSGMMRLSQRLGDYV